MLGQGIDWNVVGGSGTPRDRLLSYLKEHKNHTVRYFINEEDLAWYTRNDPFHNHQNTVIQAERILEHRIEIAGLGIVDCGPHID